MVESKSLDGYDLEPPMVQATFAAEAGTASDPIELAATSSNDEEAAAGDDDDDDGDSMRQKMVASGIAGATVGMIFGGPILAAVAGFGTAYAVRKRGAVGDAARALGDVALVAKSKAIEMDRKHKIVDHTKDITSRAWKKARSFDPQDRVLERVRRLMVTSVGTVVEFSSRHNVLERGVEGVGRSIEFVAEKVQSSRGNTTANADASPLLVESGDEQA